MFIWQEADKIRFPSFPSIPATTQQTFFGCWRALFNATLIRLIFEPGNTEIHVHYL